jgi:MinD-like ATPase involved in chromosome partitioning or flagellar assembly
MEPAAAQAEAGAWPEAEALGEPQAPPEPQASPEAASVPGIGAFPQVGAFPEPSPALEPGPAPEPSLFAEPGPVAEPSLAFEPPAVLELEPLPDPDPAPAVRPGLRSRRGPAPDPAPAAHPPASPGRSVAAKVAALFVDQDADRPVPSVERALSGPGSPGEVSWRRRVRVVTGGQGPGKRDQEALDRERARLPLPGPRRIAVLGCTSGAGQSVIALMTGHTLAAVRQVPVAALDLNPGEGSLAARIAPAISVTALLAGRGLDPWSGADAGPARTRSGRGRTRGRLDVVADDGGRALGADDYRRLAGLLADRYLLTMIDPAPSGLTRVLSLADQLVLVAPANPEAATALAHTQQWLGAHGYDELAARAVTVINGVSRRSTQDVLQAESVARGRCRAIVRVPWDDLLSPEMGGAAESPAALAPQTRLACTALAGVLIAGLVPKIPTAPSVAEPGSPAAGPRTPVPGRSAGERAD